MEGRKVCRYIELLSPKERAHFRAWLAAELGHTQQYVQKLSQLLVNDSGSFPNQKTLWVSLYPDQAYDDARLRKLSGDLTRWLERYLALQALDTRQEQVLLLKELNRRGAGKLFTQAARKSSQLANWSNLASADDFRFAYELYTEQQSFAAQQTGSEASQTKAYSPDLKTIQVAFDNWWLLEKMTLGIAGVNAARKYGQELESPLLEEVMTLIDARPDWLQNPLLFIYRRLYALLRGEEDESVEDLIALLRRHRAALAFEDYRNFHVWLTNYYIGKLNRLGKPYLAYRLFELYEWAIEDGLILIEGKLPPNHYKNLIRLCLKIKDHARAWQYLEQFKFLLPASNQEEMVALCSSYCYFAQGDYKSVIQVLSGRRFQYSLNEVEARTNLLQAHYELRADEEEWLIPQCETLIRFVRKRKDMSEYHKASYLNRLKLLRRLLNAYSVTELEKLKLAIQETRPIDRPQWLLEKLAAKLAARSTLPATQ